MTQGRYLLRQMLYVNVRGNLRDIRFGKGGERSTVVRGLPMGNATGSFFTCGGAMNAKE